MRAGSWPRSVLGPTRRRVLPIALAGGLLAGLSACGGGGEAAAAGSASDGPWFGIPLPPGLQADSMQVSAGPRDPAPAIVPAGEEGFHELEGPAIRADLEMIVAFSRRSRRTGEIGDGDLWGRISGFDSERETVAWAADRLRDAGIPRVEVQTVRQGDQAFDLPVTWEIRLLADPAFGPGTEDVVLESAMPLSAIPVEDLTAPLVFVGTATPAEIGRLDLRGKVAVQDIVPQGHTVFSRNPAGPRAEALLARKASAVLNVVHLPGNMRVRDMGCGGGPCFNLGGRDGRFLEAVLDSAAAAGTPDAVRVSLRETMERHTGLTAVNAVGVVPGRSDEAVVINAHADAWFEGAGDNGDGLAVLLALARHFGARSAPPARTLVFMVSAGHHSRGINGPRGFIADNPDLANRAVLVVNLEHTASRELVLERRTWDDGYRRWVTGSYEAPIVAGITNGSAFLEGLVREGVRRYGTNFVSAPNPMASGEGGGYRALGVPIFTAMQGSPLYHTTGELLEVVSEPGLERMARFMVFFVDQVAAGPREGIDTN